MAVLRVMVLLVFSATIVLILVALAFAALILVPVHLVRTQFYAWGRA